jgi:hypothetical protein
MAGRSVGRRSYLVTLEVRGRRSGRPLALPLVIVVLVGERYLVVHARAVRELGAQREGSGGDATLRHGRCEEMRLEELVVDRRAPVLKTYLKQTPNARAHLPVTKDAPLAEFERVAPRFSVFRVVPRSNA